MVHVYVAGSFNASLSYSHSEGVLAVLGASTDKKEQEGVVTLAGAPLALATPRGYWRVPP